MKTCPNTSPHLQTLRNSNITDVGRVFNLCYSPAGSRCHTQTCATGVIRVSQCGNCVDISQGCSDKRTCYGCIAPPHRPGPSRASVLRPFGAEDSSSGPGVALRFTPGYTPGPLRGHLCPVLPHTPTYGEGTGLKAVVHRQGAYATILATWGDPEPIRRGTRVIVVGRRSGYCAASPRNDLSYSEGRFA